MKKAVLFLAGVFTAALGFVSCNSSLEVKANADSTANLNFNLDLGEKIFSTIENMTSGIMQISSDAGLSEEINLFSAQEISDALKKSDLENLSVTVPSQREMKISGKIKSFQNSSKTLSFADFIKCDKNNLTVTLSPENIRNLVNGLPEDTKSYVALLMAPVITEEEMSNEDYLDLVALVYGDELTDVMKKAKITVGLTCPEGKTLISAKANGVEQKKFASKANFSIPLVSFLTITDSLTYKISW